MVVEVLLFRLRSCRAAAYSQALSLIIAVTRNNKVLLMSLTMEHQFICCSRSSRPLRTHSGVNLACRRKKTRTVVSTAVKGTASSDECHPLKIQENCGRDLSHAWSSHSSFFFF